MANYGSPDYSKAGGNRDRLAAASRATSSSLSVGGSLKSPTDISDVTTLDTSSLVAIVYGGQVYTTAASALLALGGGGGGGASPVAGTIDFGTVPTYAASAVFGDLSVAPTSAVLVIPQDGDEFEFDGVAYSTVSDTDAFTLYARSTGGPIAGIRSFSYVVF